jgi:hypothetical protein
MTNLRVLPFLAALSTTIALPILSPEATEACTPWAERVVAWDASADLFVMAGWDNRDRPPPAKALLPPQYYQLRRISTGEQIAWHRCDRDPPSAKAPCAWEPAFAKQVPAGTTWQRGEALPTSRVRVRAAETRGVREFSLEARADKGWRRVLYLDFIFPDYTERRRYSVTSLEKAGSDVLLALEYHATGGRCSHSAVRTLRLRETDLTDPTSAERRLRLLASVPGEGAIAHWRTVAEMGPLPPERLAEALEAAEAEGQPAWGVRWWEEATAGLPEDRRASLAASLEKRPGLTATRALLARPRSASKGK